jgi:hypothetical protein
MLTSTIANINPPEVREICKSLIEQAARRGWLKQDIEPGRGRND